MGDFPRRYGVTNKCRKQLVHTQHFSGDRKNQPCQNLHPLPPTKKEKGRPLWADRSHERRCKHKTCGRVPQEGEASGKLSDSSITISGYQGARTQLRTHS
jgi:hypothetical protein